MSQRWIIEGEWSDYAPGQLRICYREVTKSKTKANKLKAQRGIACNDGEMIYLYVRQAEKGERVKRIHGYEVLVTACLRANVWSVAELRELQEAELQELREVSK